MKVALIQAHSQLCEDYDSFYNKIEKLTIEAIKNGSYFHVWPEDITFWLLFTKERNSLIRFYEETLYDEIEYEDKSLCDILQKIQKFLKHINLKFIGKVLKSNKIIEIYKSVFSSIAKKHNCNILAGSIYEQHLDGLFNVAHVFNEHGKIICEQRKIYPIEIESAWGVLGGKTIKYFNIDGIKVAILICNDLNYIELSKECKNNHVDLVLSPSAGYVPTYLWEYNFNEYIGIVQRLRDEFCINYGRVFQCGSVNKFIKFRGMSSLSLIDGSFIYNEKALIKRETILYGGVIKCQH